jgi:mono/diheme cytochrome c family protein
MGHRSNRSLIVLLCVALVTALSCAQEEYPAGLWAEQHPAQTSEIASPPILCRQTHSQSIPVRLVAMSAAAGTGDSTVYYQQIYRLVGSVCGNCHTDPTGGFQIPPPDLKSFAAGMTAGPGGVIDHITKATCPSPANPSNPLDPMPPCGQGGGTYSQLPPNAPVYVLGQLLTEWAALGYPGQFTPGAGDGGSASAGDGGGDDGGSASAGAATSPYVMTPAVGNAMTNIGNCIPEALPTVADPKALALDAMFASLQANPQATPGSAEQVGLPLHLSETDLVSFDSVVLAQYGVVAYAPAYPLWSDDAYKLRHIRVPYGTSIHFNKATQQFELPPNTRFYKTFTKQIIDTDGSVRYRKIETRLIVARPDMNNPDGTAMAQTALFGTYQWTPDEKDAILVTTPLKDALPFGDTVIQYNVDEPLAAEIAAAPLPPDQTLEAALLNPSPPFPHTPAARTYAIPSSQRCIQCHMGSPGQVFNLGFTPLQINWRPTGTGGIIEPTYPDELNQLQRFIDYGLVTGLDSPSEVLPLEQSQGARAPRNNYELVAQGYALGNCAHCHNPRGYPSVQNPQLATIFDFLPGPTGGIFQFPLESYSPAIFRGVAGVSRIPFITPSLVDLPRYVTTAQLGVQIGSPARDIFVLGDSNGPPSYVIYAPWRSIIYRNVDSAFAYVDDIAIYPHMPFNTAGFDPRAKQILGDWMVSIPAVRKHPEIPEYAYRTQDSLAVNQEATSFIGSPWPDSTEQPYVEVRPGAPGYDEAVLEANQRLAIFHTGTNPSLPIKPVISNGIVYSRYLDPGLTADILDPAVTANPACVPIPVAETHPYPFPNHPHWVTTDLTQPPGAWGPRQPNWPQVLVEQQMPLESTGCAYVPPGQDQAYKDQVDAIHLLPNVTLGDVRGPSGTTGFAMTPFPFGLMQPPARCQLPSSVKTLADFAGEGGSGTPRPNWMQYLPPGTPQNAPVYEELPGAAVFKMICINCHGPDANSDGRLAFNLGIMTGGAAEVADFKDGLFGPANAPGSNIESVFGTSAMNAIYAGVAQDLPDASSQAISTDLSLWKTEWTGPNAAGVTITAEDRAARYLPWMALGGTPVQIPQEILEIVAVTKVLGAQRVVPLGSLSANMLSQAKALCMNLLGPAYGAPHTFNSGSGYLASPGLTGNFILTNGDAELWMRLCELANPPPVHILTVNGGALVVKPIQDQNYVLDISSNAQNSNALVDASVWLSVAPSSPVGNERGGLDSSLVVPTATNVLPGATTPGNLWPWCIDPSDAAALSQDLQRFVCPQAVLTIARNCSGNSPPATCFATDQANQWGVHGAINAGMSVFLYVQSIVAAGHRDPDYDECPSP